MPADAESELLVVLFDTQLLVQHQHAPGSNGNGAHAARPVDPDVLVQQLLVFLKLQLLINERNHLAIFAVHRASSPLLWTSSAPDTDPAAMPALILHRLQTLVQPTPPPAPAEPALSAALSRALCYTQRFAASFSGGAARARPRILCVHGGADAPVQYVPAMNAIFAAQHSRFVIDVLVLGPTESSYLQQAAHITGGLYAHPKQPEGMLQYLLTTFSADTHTRGSLNLYRPCGVDYRASCFCHKLAVDTGYVCSVCLSIFCKSNMKMPSCPMCGTTFDRHGAAPASVGPLNAAASAPGQGAIEHRSSQHH